MATAAELTPDWLTTALAPILGGARVIDVDAQPVGTGQMGDCVRLIPVYDRVTEAPDSMVAKLPAADPTSRATGAGGRSYEIEVSFYRELLASLGVRAPHCLYAEFDPETADFVLLLEDVAPALQGDQLAGCTGDQAAIAVAELPKLHAPRWGDRRLEELDWLHRNPGMSATFMATLVGAMFPGFCERYQDRLDPDILSLAETMVAALPAYLAGHPEPFTVAHGDYRLDNLLFGTSEDAPPVVVVDWQTVSYGPGVADLSYFIGAGLLPEDRRVQEEQLVRAYHEGMRAAGVDLAWNDCWTQYRRYTFGGLIMAIIASMLVERTERGDEMFFTMAHRHGRHAIDLEATEFLA